MAAALRPREIVRGLLRGAPSPRPLVLPIVFTLGAKIENLPFNSFLSNPTKICNASRQIRGYLQTDGVSCYFDRYLELEILGAKVTRTTAGVAPEISWPGRAVRGELPGELMAAEDAMRAPAVGIAVDVIHRLKMTMRDEPLLMAGVTGPLTLAAHLAQMGSAKTLRLEDFSEDTIALSSSVFAGLARAFAEAGANVIFIQEDIALGSSEERYNAWLSLLEPVCNVVRFYEALPILLLNNDSWLQDSPIWLFDQEWNCVVCPVLTQNSPVAIKSTTDTMIGVALPHLLFSPGSTVTSESYASLRQSMRTLRPVVLTTAGDIPFEADMKAVALTFEEMRQV